MRKLVIGNKNYSSWSLRAWLVLTESGLPFEEVLIPLDQPDSRWRKLQFAPTGKVPALVEGNFVIWDSLAIAEYVAEQVPAGKLWPVGRTARAIARSLASEMHSGFLDLRRQFPMNIRARRPRTPTAATAADLERITSAWGDCRKRFGSDGPFLFGRFSIADAFFAPVVTRMRTYGVALRGPAEEYAKAIEQLPSMQRWCAAAAEEPWTIAHP